MQLLQRGIFPLIDLRWYTFLSFSRICVENSLRGRFLLLLLWADYRQEYHSFRWIVWPYSLISAGRKRCLYRKTLSKQFLLVYVKITELTIEERGNVRHWAAYEQKPVEEKILQVLQVLKNTEVKGKIKTKTVSEPVAFRGRIVHSHTARPVKSSERIIGGFVYHDLLPHRSEKRYFYAAKICRFRTDSSDRTPKLWTTRHFYLAGGISKQLCRSVRGNVCPGRHELYEGLCVPAGCTVPSEIWQNYKKIKSRISQIPENPAK